ncbi:MAG TPA: ketopantoate reductase C-terminal domain-containing protein, partial [Tepidiformaceae bacterium]|nr:ketopantoate reductase C-terminal domain-containing protein [Tepidiformaceae bacterium]
RAWGADGELGKFTPQLRAEAAAGFQAAGITAVSQEEYTDRVQRHYKAMPVGGQQRNGSSTLQSVLRGSTTIEVDYLNGEIELLGKLHGVPTPYNFAVRRAATLMAARGDKPGSLSLAELALMAVSS